MRPKHYDGTGQIRLSLCGSRHLVVENFQECIRVLRTSSAGKLNLDPTWTFAVKQTSTDPASYSLAHNGKGLSVHNGEEGVQTASLEEDKAIHISEAVFG